MDLDYIIEYENENTKLDFKKEEYVKENYMSLIKDVMSMANSLDNGIKRIIIGVKDKPGADREFIGLNYLSDQAVFENIIQENIEPNIQFKYYSYKFKEKTLGILEIFDNNDKPYMMKKKYKQLEQGDMWIRKGSRQSRVTREDLDRMLDINKKRKFYNKIKLGFGENLSSSVDLSINSISNDNLPSRKRKKELENLIKELDRKYNNVGSDNDDNLIKEGLIPSTFYTGISFPLKFSDNSKSIKLGSNELGLPIYKNKEEIQDMIKKIPESYFERDQYYKFEEKGTKINLNIYNDGTEFLEDVIIELKFDENIVEIAEEIYDEPRNNNIYNIYYNNRSNDYPYVYRDDSVIYVEENYEKIRHKEIKQIFHEDLRILLKSNDYSSLEIAYKISAKNLPGLVLGKLQINLQ